MRKACAKIIEDSIALLAIDLRLATEDATVDKIAETTAAELAAFKAEIAKNPSLSNEQIDAKKITTWPHDTKKRMDYRKHMIQRKYAATEKIAEDQQQLIEKAIDAEKVRNEILDALRQAVVTNSPLAKCKADVKQAALEKQTLQKQFDLARDDARSLKELALTIEDKDVVKTIEAALELVHSRTNRLGNQIILARRKLEIATAKEDLERAKEELTAAQAGEDQQKIDATQAEVAAKESKLTRIVAANGPPPPLTPKKTAAVERRAPTLPPKPGPANPAALSQRNLFTDKNAVSAKTALNTSPKEASTKTLHHWLMNLHSCHLASNSTLSTHSDALSSQRVASLGPGK